MPFSNCEQMNQIILLLIFYEKCNENFQFCTKKYTRSTRNGIESVFNNQTVLILLLLVKTVCGIDLLSFNKILWCMQIPLIVWLTGMKICLMGHLTDSWQLHSLLGFMFALGFTFVTQDMINVA